MKLKSIEPTPSPNTMKLNLDFHLPAGQQKTYLPEHADNAPHPIRELLQIENIRSIFHTADFLAIDRRPNADWRAILASVGEVLGGENQNSYQTNEDSGFGEVKVYVQMFRSIPMQLRVKDEKEEVRKSLSSRFVDTAMEAGYASSNLIRERKLKEWGIRYGELETIANEVLEELEAAYDDNRLLNLKEKAVKLGEGEEVEEKLDWTAPMVVEALKQEDWRKRYAALEQWRPEEDDQPTLALALKDDHASVRREAVIHLGELGGPASLALLIEAIEDPSPAVRRTAGDSLSDLGDPVAISAMCKTLEDKNKLVRWRAARYLFEIGDETALDALKQAVDDPEFEVSLQIRQAIERIESGEEAAGTVWQQMTKGASKH